MNIEEIVNRVAKMLDATEQEKTEITSDITDSIEKEVLSRLSTSQRLAGYLEQNRQASLADLALALENDKEYQQIYQTSILTIIGDWVRSVSSALSNEEKQRLSNELHLISQQLQSN